MVSKIAALLKNVGVTAIGVVLSGRPSPQEAASHFVYSGDEWESGAPHPRLPPVWKLSTACAGAPAPLKGSFGPLPRMLRGYQGKFPQVGTGVFIDDRVFGGNGAAGLGSGVTMSHGTNTVCGSWLLIARGRVVPHAAGSGSLTPTVSFGVALVGHHGQRPAPAGQLAGDGDVGDHGPLLAVGEADPALVQPVVARLRPRDRGRGRQLPAAPQHRGRPVRLAVVPGRLDQQPAGVGVAGLGDRALRPGSPRRSAPMGTSPRKEPMVAPVNRCQSPISTASANPVSVETPRRQPSRRTTGVNSLSAAICGDRRVEPVPAGRGQQHRLVVGLERQPACPASVEALPHAATRRARRSRPSRRSRRSRAAAAASTAGAGPASGPRGRPPGPGPGPGPPPAPRSAPRTASTSSSRSSRARCTASRASVLTRSPAGRCSFDGAATSHRIPAAVSARDSPNPVGPAS